MKHRGMRAILLIICLCCLSQPLVSRGQTKDTSQELHKTLEEQTKEIQQVKEALEKQRVELAKQTATKYSHWNVYWVPIISPLAALIAAVGGWFITYGLLKSNFAEQAKARAGEWNRQDEIRQDDLRVKENERMELYLVDALKYFEGHTQKRNIGIAFVEAYWGKFPGLEKTWTAVLANQAIYILTKVLDDKNLTLHELDNFERILELLKKSKLQSYQYEQLQKAMGRFSPKVVEEINDEQLKVKIEECRESLGSIPHA